MREAERLRARQLFSADLRLPNAGDAAVLVPSEQEQGGSGGGDGGQPHGQPPLRMLELLATFNVTAPAAVTSSSSSSSAGLGGGVPLLPFTVGATIHLGGGGVVSLTLTGSASPSKGGGEDDDSALTVQAVDMWVDTTRAGGATQGRRWGGPVLLPPGGLPAQGLQLRAFADRSLLEVYGLGGRQRTTARVYPLDGGGASFGASLFAHVGGGPGAAATATAAVWELRSCWVGDAAATGAGVADVAM